jgi:hypothetical protein
VRRDASLMVRIYFHVVEGGVTMEKFSAEFELEKETKNTYRMKEVTNGEPPKIGTIYLAKWLSSDGLRKIKITVEDA